MIQNPILKVLSTFKRCKVKSLLIGGQACIVWGTVEFSRDSDFIVLCNSKNLALLKKALDTLKAKNIYVPPLEAKYLKKGHACHFRCQAKGVEGLRIDVISKLRGCDSFEKLWKRRKIVYLGNRITIDVIGLKDLIQSKKTQRDKDWFMLRRLVENDIILNKNPKEKQIKWWLLESREPNSLIRLARENPEIAKECVAKRPLLSSAIASDAENLNLLLQGEEQRERQKDIEYWATLKKELGILRHRILSKGNN